MTVSNALFNETSIIKDTKSAFGEYRRKISTLTGEWC